MAWKRLGKSIAFDDKTVWHGKGVHVKLHG